MAALCNLGFANFYILKFLVVADRIETTNMHRHTNFIKNGQMVADISHSTIVKMVAIRRLGFLKV